MLEIVKLFDCLLTMKANERTYMLATILPTASWQYKENIPSLSRILTLKKKTTQKTPSTTDPKWTVGIFRAFFFKEKKNISAAFGPGVWFFSFQRSNLDDFRTFPTHPDQSPLNGIPLLIPSGLRRRWNDTTKHRKRTLRGEVATIDQDMQQKLSNNTLKRFGFLFYPVLPYDFMNQHTQGIHISPSR